MGRSLTAAAIVAFLASAVLATVDAGHYPWYVSRATGLLSMAMLNASVVLGLLLSAKSAPAWFPKPMLFELHQFLSVLALALVAVHTAALLFDGVAPFTAAQALIPFVAPYDTAEMAMGIIAGWLTALVTASFWAKKRIGQKAWRRLHYASFAAYGLGLVHALGVGSDVAIPFVYWSSILGAALVAALTVYRIGAVRARPAPRRPAVSPARAPGPGSPRLTGAP